MSAHLKKLLSCQIHTAAPMDFGPGLKLHNKVNLNIQDITFL